MTRQVSPAAAKLALEILWKSESGELNLWWLEEVLSSFERESAAQVVTLMNNWMDKAELK